ncbi:MAG: hypothetical protein Q9192_005981 [Flavoplaca navasiana]
MKQTIFFTALSSSILYSSVFARYGLNPDDIPMLTRTVDYTFHSICDNYHNPVPTPVFNELGLARTIFDLTNDLYSFLMGYSVGSDDNDNTSNHIDNKRVVVAEHPSLKTRLREEDQRGPGLLQDLIDDVMQSNRRSELLESQTVFGKGPISDKVMEQEETMHSYAAKKKFDCPKFQHDLYENMTYAISEKCYRQCTPTATYNTPAYAAYAVQRLQTAYERHYSGVSFPFPPFPLSPIQISPSPSLPFYPSPSPPLLISPHPSPPLILFPLTPLSHFLPSPPFPPSPTPTDQN